MGGKIMNDSISWGELAELTHETQVERFGFCSCEDLEPHEYPYPSCLTRLMS
jgi:hypothetical protein